MKSPKVQVLLTVFFVLAVIASSGLTYALFPRTVTVVEKTPQVTVTWGIAHGYHYSPAVIMQHLGLLEKYSGDRVTLEVVVLGSSAISEAIIAGSMQFGQRSAPAVLKNIDSGASFRMLLSVGKKDHEFWVSDPNIQSIADLTKDHPVAVVTQDSIEEIGLRLGLQRIGKSLEDIDVMYLKHDVAYQAMLTGELVGDYTGAPYPSRYAREPDKFHLIATDTDLFQMMLPASVVYADASYLEANPDIVSCVTSAWFEVIAWINENPEETARVTATFFEDPLDKAYEDWQDARIVFDPTMGLSSVSPLSEMLADAGVLERAYTAEELLFFVSLGGSGS